MNRGVEFSPEALGDLIDLYDYIAVHDGPERAMGYIERIEDFCRNLSTFPGRGSRRDDLSPGLRILDTRPQADYANGHIRGAIRVDVKSWQSLGKKEGG
ncbi:MAG: type II toxin-antitoxin system RelE/ParE family toxin, partial [Acidobacteriota bacterium]|nr:type II toxin-antitoxin system RelE/ParE family toxin [Acidobacteriota bacterium]